MLADSDQRILIRRYQPGDETSILRFFEESFHQQRTLEHWQWKYRENPAGAEHISLAFNGAQELVAHYAAYPVFLQDGDQVGVIHQIGDTMTAPSIRHIGRGQTSVLGRTAHHFFDSFCEGKVVFNYGFNVGNIQRFSERFLRSFRVDSVAYRTRDLVAHPMKSVSRWERLTHGYRLELLTETSAEWDDLFARVAPSYECLVRRDAQYVRWRYLTRPDVRYAVVSVRRRGKLVGWLVFLVRENRLTIGDALFDPQDPGALEFALRHLVPQYPVQRIEGWFPQSPSWFDDVLSRVGMVLKQEPQDLALMCTPFLRADAVERMRSAFYYTMGDSDLF
jgi:hypothetical protein